MMSVNMKLKQILSIVITFAILTFLINWKMAILFIIGIGFHELSHLWAARFLKLETDGFYLIPFIGGVAFIKEKCKSFRQQVFISIMGPIGGGLIAAVCAIIYYFSKNIYFAAAAEWLFIINIFNLLPLSFLDGGRIMSAITYSINDYVGVYCLVISTILAIALIGALNPMLIGLMLIWGIPEVWRELASLKAVEEGKLWLASKEFLIKPTKLSRKDIVLTILIYTLVISGMSVWCYKLSLIPNANVGYIIGNK